MILFIIFFKYRALNNDPSNHLEQQAQPPVFIDGMNTAVDEKSEKFNQQVLIDTDVIGSKMSSFLKCTLDIRISRFEKCFAFGSGQGSESGGAIHAYECVINLQGQRGSNTQSQKGIIFHNNEAAVGGAICSLSSAMLATFVNFTSNTAYKYGGAIYFQGSYEENNDKSQLNPQVKMIGYNLFFADNRAHELGGAVSLSLAIEFYLENSLLKGNVCGYNGGGIFSTNVDHLSLYSCIFTNNIVDATDTKAMQASTSLRISIKQSDKEGYANKQASHFSARGGGAVSFMSDMRKGSLPMGATTNLHRDFKTVKCCFYKNSATQTGQTFGNGAGHEILFEGYVKYKSYKDYISGYSGEDLNSGAVSQYISRIIRGWDDNATIIQIDNRLTDPNSVCESITGSDVDTPDETAPSYANTNRNIQETTSNVPLPTSFTYRATPISRLPRATSRSHKEFTPPSYDVHKPDFWNDNPTPDKKPDRTLPPTPFIAPSSGKTQTLTIIYTESKYKTHLTSGGTYYNGETYVVVTSEGEYSAVEIITTETLIFLLDDGTDPENKPKLSLYMIIGIAGGAFLLVVIAIIISILVVRHKKDEESSSVEMNEETITRFGESTTIPVTNENPLWTTSILGDKDDPFKDDFEETPEGGMFEANEDERSSD